MKLVVAITGASGVIYAVRLLEVLKNLNVETHLIVSENAKTILKLELNMNTDALKSLCSHIYDNNDLTAPMASGSFQHNGMVIIPCSMKTLAGIATGYAENLILRAADVTLKLKKPLILVIRETPYNLIHVRNMLKAMLAGAIVLPASPAFYYKPKTIDDIVNYVVGRVLDVLGLKHNLYSRWKEV